MSGSQSADSGGVSTAAWIALAAAFLLGSAAVFQHRAAATAGRFRAEPATRSESPHRPHRMLRRVAGPVFRLVGQYPVWVAGIGLLIAGNALQAVALGTGRLLVVEPLAVTSLLFGLPLSALWWRHRLRVRDWSAAILVSAGVWGFLVLGHAAGGTNTASLNRWLMAIGAVAGGALIFVGASHPSRALRPTGLALAAGMSLGLSDGLTKTSVPLLLHHGVFAFTYWEPYALVVCAAGGYGLLQFAYRHGHLAQCLPAAVLAQPVTGALVGVLVLGERLQDGIPAQAGQAASVALAAIAVVMLARSPRVLALTHSPGFASVADGAE
jgi:drug/metabolite transporter (DMT)-like permease